MPDRPLDEAGPLDGIELLDHHCHGVVETDLDRPAFEALLSEAPAAAARDRFDSLLGLAVRRWCAPVLDLEPHADPDEYLQRRAALGWAEVTRRLLRASGTRTGWVDTGHQLRSLTTPERLASLGGGRAYPVARLEAVAERAGAVAATDGGATGWADAVERAVRAEAAGAVGLKTAVAYRTGLAVPADPPPAAAVEHAAGGWLRGIDTGAPARIADPVLGTWLVHLGVRVSAELGLPLQVHTGFGDTDVRLTSANPALLTDLLIATERTGARFMLLHCWPYHREAGYLAHVFDHVRVDVGLAVPYVGARAREVLAGLFELAPFSSVCFSSDGYGLPELHFLGALLWRRALGGLLGDWTREGVLTVRDARRLARAIARDNARSEYPLPPSG